ncbi:MAG: hypothetical protein HFE74_02370 [Firmicutes bacterium]|jgi:hypothetical protein|nr:hypothetical protein [Bacillota bacterium]
MFTKEFLYELLLIVGPIIQILIFLYIVWKFDLEKYYIIIFKTIPYYNKLEKEYNAKYPTETESIFSFDIHDLYSCSNLETFFFVSDSSFHIVSKIRPNFHIEIPFESVLYHDSHINMSSKYNYNYSIEICFLLDEYGKTAKISFSTLDYNHRLDKKYGSRLSGEELYNFINENFINRETYNAKNSYRTSH